MTQRPPPVDGFDKSDPSQIRVNEVIGEKSANGEIIFQNKSLKSEKILRAQIFSMLTELYANVLSPKGKNAQYSNEDIRLLLCDFKQVLLKLSEKNLSSSADYAEKLSTLWNQLLIVQEQKMAVKKKYFDNSLLKKFLKKLQNYPKDSGHTFGYYLSEYAGENWLPFPFIEILQKLYEDAIINDKNAILLTWASSIDQILKPHGQQ